MRDIGVEFGALRYDGTIAVAAKRVGPEANESDRRPEEVAQTVANALHWDLALPRHRIVARCNDGWVTLTGAVERAYQRSAAEADFSDERARGTRRHQHNHRGYLASGIWSVDGRRRGSERMMVVSSACAARQAGRDSAARRPWREQLPKIDPAKAKPIKRLRRQSVFGPDGDLQNGRFAPAIDNGRPRKTAVQFLGAAHKQFTRFRRSQVTGS